MGRAGRQFTQLSPPAAVALDQGMAVKGTGSLLVRTQEGLFPPETQAAKVNELSYGDRGWTPYLFAGVHNGIISAALVHGKD